jgi:hypothetical protein
VLYRSLARRAGKMANPFQGLIAAGPGFAILNGNVATVGLRSNEIHPLSSHGSFSNVVRVTGLPRNMPTLLLMLDHCACCGFECPCSHRASGMRLDLPAGGQAISPPPCSTMGAPMGGGLLTPVLAAGAAGAAEVTGGVGVAGEEGTF